MNKKARTLLIFIIIALLMATVFFYHRQTNEYRNSINRNIELVKSALPRIIVDDPKGLLIAYSKIENLRAYHNLTRFENNLNRDKYSFAQVAYIALSNKMLKLAEDEFNNDTKQQAKELLNSAFTISNWYSNDYDAEVNDLLDEVKLTDSIYYDDGIWKLK